MIFETDNFQLFNGDCLKIMQSMQSESIDLTVTSPPYDNLRLYQSGRYKDNNYLDIIKELYRVTKRGGVCVWVVSDQTIKGSETLTSFRQALMFRNVGFNVHDTMIWRKDSSSFPDRARYTNVFEYMFVFSKGKPSVFNPIEDRKNKRYGEKLSGSHRNYDGSITQRSKSGANKTVKEYGKRFNVWDISAEKNNRTGHPAVFPLQLAQDNIISWSNNGATVLDIFMGSGTTGVACLKTNRKFIGIELEREYYEKARDRLKDFKKNVR